MNCDFNFCIYNKASVCALKEIQVDSLGMCESCIIVTIQDDVLEALKETQLKKLESRYEGRVE